MSDVTPDDRCANRDNRHRDRCMCGLHGDAETAWQEWADERAAATTPYLRHRDNTQFHSGFLAGYAVGNRVGAIEALNDAADAMDAQKPTTGYVVVYPERVGGWLRDRAAAVENGGQE